MLAPPGHAIDTPAATITTATASTACAVCTTAPCMLAGSPTSEGADGIASLFKRTKDATIIPEFIGFMQVLSCEDVVVFTDSLLDAFLFTPSCFRYVGLCTRSYELFPAVDSVVIGYIYETVLHRHVSDTGLFADSDDIEH
jgi:hypothetical protein